MLWFGFPDQGDGDRPADQPAASLARPREEEDAEAKSSLRASARLSWSARIEALVVAAGAAGGHGRSETVDIFEAAGGCCAEPSFERIRLQASSAAKRSHVV